MMKLTTRAYRQQLPEVDDLVMVKYRESTDAVIYAELLEYPHVEGMMILSEYSRSANDIRKAYFESGKQDVLRVLEVLPARNMVSLSKRHRKPEEAAEYGKHYAKTAKVAKIASEWAAATGVDELQLYETFIWDLYDEYEHAYDYFVTACETDNMPPIGAEALRQVLKKRLVKREVKIEAVVEVTCFAAGGVTAIRETLSSLPAGVSCVLVASPAYSLWVTTRDEEAGRNTLLAAIETLKNAGSSLDVNVSTRRDPIIVAA